MPSSTTSARRYCGDAERLVHVSHVGDAVSDQQRGPLIDPVDPVATRRQSRSRQTTMTQTLARYSRLHRQHSMCDLLGSETSG